MTKKRISLSITQPVLKRIIAEQISRFPEVELNDLEPDMVIADTSTENAHLLLGKGGMALPLRLGSVTDQIRYQLSSRTRLSMQQGGQVALGPFMLQPEESCIVHSESGQVIRLTEKERQFLLTLYQAPGHSLDRRALLDEVWNYADDVETHTLETHLYRLRQKLESCGGQDLIVSKDGVYRLNI